MPKNNRWKTGGNKRVAFRNQQRKTGAGVRVYFGTQSFGVSTVRSLNRLMKPLTRRRDKIMSEWLKVKKRMDELIAEGYRFGGRLQDIYNGFLHNTQRELDFLKQMTKRELRVLSESYKGVVDVKQKMDLLNKERAARRAEKKRILEEQRAQDMLYMDQMAEMEAAEQEKIYVNDMKIQNIIGEEMDYIEECMEWDGYVDELRRTECAAIAQEIADTLDGLSDEDKESIIDFWENTGGLYEIIQQGENRYWGMFYDAAVYNSQLLRMTGLTGRELQAIAYNPDVMDAKSYHYNPASRDFDESDVGIPDDRW